MSDRDIPDPIAEKFAAALERQGLTIVKKDEVVKLEDFETELLGLIEEIDTLERNMEKLMQARGHTKQADLSIETNSSDRPDWWLY